MEQNDSSLLKRLDEIDKSRIALFYKAGAVRNGIRYKLFIYIIGPTMFQERPRDCTYNQIQFPNQFFTVHISFDKDEAPVLNTRKYYCKHYQSAKNLADKIKIDKGIDIMDLNTIQEIEDDQSNFEYGISFSQYAGGPTGDLSDDFINDVLDGNPDMYWNID